MRMTATVFAASASLAFVPVATAQSFEGVIVWTMYEKGKPAGEMTTSLKGTKARMESPKMEGAFQIFDVAAQAFYTVMPSQKMYMKIEASGPDEEPLKGKFTPTERRETIAGRECTHYLYEEDGETTDICAAKGLGFPVMGGTLAQSGQAGSLPRNLREHFKDGFQPLKTELVKGERRELVMQVKSIEAKSLPAELFEIPAGFQEMKMPSLPGLRRRP